jgi:hypothetical protein
MISTWRYFFDLLVVVLSGTSIYVALALIRAEAHAVPAWILRMAAWVACGMLTLRGIAGLIVDGLSDPVWWPAFLTGGILFGSVAWTARAAYICRASTPTA